MKRVLFIVIVFLIGFMLGCYIQYNYLSTKRFKENKNVSFSPHVDNPYQTIYEKNFIDSVLRTGNVQLYEQLRRRYDFKIYEFIGVAMVMANKYNYPNAYEDVFEGFHAMLKSGSISDTSFTYINYDAETKRIALKYLNAAVERNNLNAIQYLCLYSSDCNKNRTIDSIWNIRLRNKESEMVDEASNKRK